ncbi:hypothetical protein F5Y14DRAFT_446460 [Nemania sp. NC0429]|nr:hypothetical protein F5Y14DRAFT_446460 [Nemania sp. NC0429]
MANSPPFHPACVVGALQHRVLAEMKEDQLADELFEMGLKAWRLDLAMVQVEAFVAAAGVFMQPRLLRTPASVVHEVCTKMWKKLFDEDPPWPAEFTGQRYVNPSIWPTPWGFSDAMVACVELYGGYNPIEALALFLATDHAVIYNCVRSVHHSPLDW